MANPLAVRRPLGRTGLEVSAIGLGTGSIGAASEVESSEGQETLAVATVQAAIELGINYVDTSPNYRGGASEGYLGLALRGGARDKVVLATKVGTHPVRPNDYTRAAVLWSVEQSRKALNTDVIDIILVHDIPDITLVMQPGGGIEGLEELKSRGVIRAIGLAVQNHAFMRVAIESNRFDVIQSPYDYNLIRSTSEPLMALASENRIGFINASPFNQGLVAGIDPNEIVRIRRITKMWAARRADVARARAIWKWAQASNVDIRALAIQYCVRESRISTTLIGPRTPQELEQDLQSASANLRQEAWEALKQAMRTWPAPSPGGEAATGAYAPDK